MDSRSCFTANIAPCLSITNYDMCGQRASFQNIPSLSINLENTPTHAATEAHAEKLLKFKYSLSRWRRSAFTKAAARHTRMKTRNACTTPVRQSSTRGRKVRTVVVSQEMCIDVAF